MLKAVEQITSYFASLLPIVNHTRVVPVIFASTFCAPLIDPTQSSLGEIVNSLFGRIHAGNPPAVAYTVTAVVDKIAGNTGYAANGEVFTHQAPQGREGLSLLLADATGVTARGTKPTRTRGAASEEPAFILSTMPDAGKGALSHEVGLRLANTIFVNGKDRTLMGMKWNFDAQSQRYVLDKCRDLGVCSVGLSQNPLQCSINIPLMPVTPPRRVVSSMGNILRQVSKSLESTADAHPASADLEKELPRYVSSLGVPHQRVSVWALVEPAESARPVQEWSAQQLEEAVSRGARLHRVMSGGGGWGKKQGLLSLDPEISFRDEKVSRTEAPVQQVLDRDEHATDLDSSSDVAEILDLSLEENIATLSQIAKEGDYIQFFVETPSAKKAIDESLVETQSQAFSATFAVAAPSDISPGAVGDAGENAHDPERNLSVLLNCFGGLSETAITYRLKGDAADFQRSTKLSMPGAQVELKLLSTS